MAYIPNPWEDYPHPDSEITKAKLDRLETAVAATTDTADTALSVAQAAGGGGVTDHGALTGLADDDHTQYHTDTRGDLRYYTKAQSDTLLSGKSDTTHGHVIADVTSLQTSLDNKADFVHSHPSSQIIDIDERIRDTMGTALVAGSNVTITPDDAGNTITIAASSGGGSSAMDFVSLALTTDQTYSTNTQTPINWDTETEDATGYHDNVTNKSRITVPTGKGGLFSVDVGLNIKGSSLGQTSVLIRKNGSTDLRDTGGYPSGQGTGIGITGVYRLAAGDYIEILVWTSTGTGVALWGGYCFAQIVRLSA